MTRNKNDAIKNLRVESPTNFFYMYRKEEKEFHSFPLIQLSSTLQSQWNVTNLIHRHVKHLKLR